MLRKMFIVAVCGLLFCGNARAKEEDVSREGHLTDILKEPIKKILAPVKMEGLADIVFKPLEKVLSSITDLGEVVVTPGRTREYVYNINRNVSVITEEDFLEDNTQYLQQALSREAGIVMSGYMNNAKDNNVDMRGFGETGLLNYVVLIDGRRTNQIDMSGVDLSQIDINSVEKVEILRGANSVLYGDNATGGVINIITKKGQGEPHIEYIQEFGSYQYNKEYVSASGGHDFLDYFFSYSYQNSNGYRLNNDYEANDILANIIMKPADYIDLKFSSSYHKDWYGQPGALYDGNLKSDGRQGSRYPNDKAKTEDYYFTVNPRVFGECGDHEYVVSSFLSYRSRRTNSRSVGFNIYEINHHIGSWDFRPKCEVNSTLFGGAVENKLVFGVDYFRARDRILSGDVAFTKSQLDITKETFGIYVSDNMLINQRFIVNGGVRGEWAEYIFDQYQPTGSYNTRSLREIALDAGAGYKYNKRSQVYVNFARSYRNPATDEFFQSAFESSGWPPGTTQLFPAVLNASLKQQVGNNYEIGIKDNTFSPVSVKASYFVMDNKNEIYYDPITYQNENYHHVMRHGLELVATANIYDKLKILFNYTFEKAFFVGGKFASKTVPLVPENKISAGVNVEPFQGFNLNCSVNYIGSRYMASDQQNTISKLKSHVTVDLNAFYEYKNIRIFGSVKNMLGEKYFSNATKNWQGNPAFYPAPEMTIEGGVSVKF